VLVQTRTRSYWSSSSSSTKLELSKGGNILNKEHIFLKFLSSRTRPIFKLGLFRLKTFSHYFSVFGMFENLVQTKNIFC
jgi:hypothetical protein